MVRVMMQCPYDGKEIYVGLDISTDAPLTGYSKKTISCAHCHRTWPLRLLYFEGNGPLGIHAYHVALDSAREFAAEIGIFISCFAIVEGYLDDLMAKLTDTTERDAWTILGRHQVGERVRLLQALATLRTETNPQRMAVERLLPRLSWATATRNKYAHSQYSITFDDAIIVSSWLYDSKKRSKTEITQTLDLIVAEVQTIKSLINDLHGYVHRGEMPPPLFEKDSLGK